MKNSLQQVHEKRGHGFAQVLGDVAHAQVHASDFSTLRQSGKCAAECGVLFRDGVPTHEGDLEYGLPLGLNAAHLRQGGSAGVK